MEIKYSCKSIQNNMNYIISNVRYNNFKMIINDFFKLKTMEFCIDIKTTHSWFKRNISIVYFIVIG